MICYSVIGPAQLIKLARSLVLTICTVNVLNANRLWSRRAAEVRTRIAS